MRRAGLLSRGRLAGRKGGVVRTARTSANLGFEAELWAAANALRGSMDAAEHKHDVLGLMFLKYISDAFQEHHAKLESERDQGAHPEDPDEYRVENIFWVPPEARWSELQKNARQPTIGGLVDRAMEAVLRDNPSLKGVLPKEYARPALDKTRLGQLIDLISNLHLGGSENHARDILGPVYEYFFRQFATAEGKKGGEFYTPRCIVILLVEILCPYRGRVYNPCCGSGGMFVQSEEFIKAYGGRIGDLPSGRQVAGRARAQIGRGESLTRPYITTWRLGKMNLAVHGIDGRIEQGDSFANDRFPDLKADYIFANPPFNMKNWGGEHLHDDKQRKLGVPPANNANFAWVQHMIHHLEATGIGGFVPANGSMSSNQSGEGEIRKIADTYYAWHGGPNAGEYGDFPGFCKIATLEEIRQHGHVLTPGRHVGAPEQEEDDEPFEAKMARLVAQLAQQQAEARRLDEAMSKNLKELGYDT